MSTSTKTKPGKPGPKSKRPAKRGSADTPGAAPAATPTPVPPHAGDAVPPAPSDALPPAGGEAATPSATAPPDAGTDAVTATTVPKGTPARKRHVGHPPGGKRVAAPRAAKPAKPPKPITPKRVSLLDAAATVLAGAKEPMMAKEIVAEVLSRGLWSTKGETPEATLYAAMIREIANKKSAGGGPRFKKVDRGLFIARKEG
ncbi:MAG: winged helix-turn-helix domain-containing protein [Phycisphaerae bacterium]|nr:winged helix-turn-helix domain-containing protein [Phycisphaerae bacterium]